MSKKISPKEEVYKVARLIPKGKVTTYGELAGFAGLGRGARQVGRILRELPSGSNVPWWRVINAQGKISLRSFGMQEQIEKLQKEGIVVSPTGKIDLKRYQWDG